MVTKIEAGRGTHWQYGINRCTLPHIKQINNKDLPYSKGNYTQYIVINYNGAEFLKEYRYIHIYIQLYHFAVHLKLTQSCKSTILQ